MEDEVKGINRLTTNAKRVIEHAYSNAVNYKYTELKAIHIFYTLLQDKGGIVFEILNKLGVDIDSSAARIQKEFEEHQLLHTNEGFKTVFAQEVKDVINQSFVVAFNLNHLYIGTEHLLLSMFSLKNVAFIEELKSFGLTEESIKKTLASVGNYNALANVLKGPEMQQFNDSFSEFGQSNKAALPYFTRNMNEIAEEEGFPNISGRDQEIQRLIHILARKTKNNPILVGDAGVGKTAIVEGFVNAIVKKKVPASFINAKVLSLDIGAVLSGAKLRGDVEERITAVINEAMTDENTIIFIDEIHNIVGAGSAGGKDTMDIANMLKPYLTNSSLSIIGATTQDEYSKYFETDSALTRRFQPIKVEELSIESAKHVISKVTPELEKYHNVKISEDAVNAAVDLSSKFIQDRYLPDKAIDVLDEAAASVKVGRERALEPQINELSEQLIEIQNTKNNALKDQDFKKAADLKEKEEEIVEEIQQVINGKRKTGIKYSKVVSTDLIKDIIVEWTKIPIAAADISDKRLKDLAINLKKRIVGEDRVIDNVAQAVQKSHLGLNGGSRPLASFMFLGPTGVGKTELAKTLAKELFGSENLLHQINMSEYMEMHSVSKLIGSPPGYVGFQEGGQLTTFVKRKPYSVVLFDEIEKAHLDVLNLLLQILEEGELTDGKGNRVSFKNTIIILTSNIGAEEISEDSKLGFNIDVDDIKKDEIEEAYDEMRDRVMEELRETLRPELLNRIDLIDIFRGLNKDDCLKIAKLITDEFVKRLIPLGILLEVDDSVISKINDDGYSKEYGARNIRRKVQELLENGLAEYLLKIKLPKKRRDLLKIAANVKAEKVVFSS
jgi:ATP-dependent Clp protease ATP-binding subunit ClpC